ncbi:uncharacterized protein DUF4233 [Frondihabitans sp. PhB188]|uniref:DUF4233 domain-containing protein n=1 Tax=Frondihabitans sp. PhB188 TaxID=2485200 RepID=UPI000F487F0C|nr:DUF4233 domain-containing protein [Frondihabitans sp. PhB188]ROQ38286.1 uncharacterized protein DUF4233 [Frondihabitans sp. PhB188]
MSTVTSEPQSTPQGSPRGRTPRARRDRSLTESLLSIMLVLEACVLFFVVLNVGGAGILPWSVAIGGGLAFFALMIVTAATLRYRAGVVLGCVLQVLLALTGLLVVLMWVVAAIFIAIWIFCLYKGITIDRRNAALRQWMAEHPGIDPRTYQA